MDIKSANLQMQLHKNKTGVKGDTVEDRFQELLNECSDAHGFKHISVDGVYDDETNTFHEDVKTYSILYTLGRYAEIEGQMKDFARKLYPLYEEGDLHEFYNQCSAVTRMINQGKTTKKQMTKAHSISRSLDMLITLDEDYCKFLVNKFLAKDEFFDLDSKMRSLKI